MIKTYLGMWFKNKIVFKDLYHYLVIILYFKSNIEKWISNVVRLCINLLISLMILKNNLKLDIYNDIINVLDSLTNLVIFNNNFKFKKLIN